MIRVLRNKKVIFTCLFGNYDTLEEPEVIDPTFDYICFSNHLNQSDFSIWKIVEVPRDINLSEKELSRLPKLKPFSFLLGYDYSLYHDANITIISHSFYRIIDDLISNNSLFALVKHPERSCIYDELAMCLKLEYISEEEYRLYDEFLSSTRFPKEYGLFENNLIFRSHSSDRVKEICNNWWNIFIKNEFPRRDQLSLMFLFWKFSFNPDLIFSHLNSGRNHPSLKYKRHNTPLMVLLTRKLLSYLR